MKSSLQVWSVRIAILIAITVVVLFATYQLNATDWADGFRTLGEGRGAGHGPGGGRGLGNHEQAVENIGFFVHYLQPLLETFLKIGLPMLVGLLVGLTYQKLMKKKAKPSTNE